MLLIIIVTIIIITTIMTTEAQQSAIQKPLLSFPRFDQSETHLCGFSSLLQRFITAGSFYMQLFGTPPIRTATKRTFTLTNYYHPLYVTDFPLFDPLVKSPLLYPTPNRRLVAYCSQILGTLDPCVLQCRPHGSQSLGSPFGILQLSGLGCPECPTTKTLTAVAWTTGEGGGGYFGEGIPCRITLSWHLSSPVCIAHSLDFE